MGVFQENIMYDNFGKNFASFHGPQIQGVEPIHALPGWNWQGLRWIIINKIPVYLQKEKEFIFLFIG